MTDPIERQDAINVLEERPQANGYSNVALVSELNRSIGYLMRLPSAQSNLQSTCNQLATDSISRQEAIDLFLAEGMITAAVYVERMPSAQPEPRQKAHWINVRDGNIADCGMCNARGRAWMNFCPICGADMREEQ